MEADSMDRHRSFPVSRILSGFALSFLFTAASAATDLEGDLSGHLPAGVYRIVEDVAVPAGQTLTLAPGVVFEFEDDFWEEYELDVRGTLDAQGTDTAPIHFRTASGVSEYNYIRIGGGASVLRHCRIEDAGKVTALDEGGLWIDGCSPLIEDCEVVSGSWHGIWVTGAGAAPEIRRTFVHGNGGDGISASGGAGVTVFNAVVRDNGGDGICVSDGTNRIVGSLVVGNAEDGIDCRGISPFEALLINDTVADNGSENLSDSGLFDLYNTIVVGIGGSPRSTIHSWITEDPAFFRFVDRPYGLYRLDDDSPARERGTRFGPPATWLPDADLAGNPRIVGIVDLGATESTAPADPGTGGTWFSSALVGPRMTQPAFAIPGERIRIRIARLGAYDPGEYTVRLIDPLALARDLSVVAATGRDAAPGTDLAAQLHTVGIETIQEITAEVPDDLPAGLYDLEIDLRGDTYRSHHAVRIVEAYPEEWTFLHITDTHIGYDEEAYTAGERLRFFVREANFLNPHLVVVTGDICENQSLENVAYADSFLAAIAELRVPILVQPGNHDHYNDHGDYNPAGFFRYFQSINRYRNAVLRFGPASFFALNTGSDQGVDQLYRCLGPTDEALDWMESVLGTFDPVDDHPRFLLTHGPNYDYFSYNAQNTGRVRDLLDQYDFALGLAGHTHRFETFRNEGDNWFGRNDYSHDHDWIRDVPFPGYPLHVQTSALGKEEHLGAALDSTGRPVLVDHAGHADPSVPSQRGLFGDDIAFRAIRVADGSVASFTADIDGDGYRNTENAWLLGELEFASWTEDDGRIVSEVTN
ncbi:MAG: hypothetical protein GF346_12115, partial [Candidatus Eisenbacteria bacterium]|nr:hypothetical protein [Candidatus Latescibacterota bacterium]MBD3303182.1 hypothetical protein [Candidatus Eisenbacteria bacterium]